MAGINLRRSLFGGNDIAIDLGTANTLIYVKGVGVMVDEPTLIAVNKEDGSILTVGEEAKNLVGRVPDSIKLINKYFEKFKQAILVDQMENQELKQKIKDLNITI